ncbi:MAG: nuclear transport factor 2 family protein [Gammaproteobacteria bacterium]|nr:nuclear transport factor 2 family protein [Gammaproteobacteria bacterium]
MKNVCYAVVVILLFGMGAAHAGDQIGRWLSPGDPIAKTITALEDMWAHTACSSVPAALKAAFADDFQGTFPNGQRYGRPTNWGGEGGNTDCQLQQIQIRLFGDAVALAYGNESSVSKKKDGSAEKHCLAWTDTWLKLNGKWQIVAAQDNRVTCK